MGKKKKKKSSKSVSLPVARIGRFVKKAGSSSLKTPSSSLKTDTEIVDQIWVNKAGSSSLKTSISFDTVTLDQIWIEVSSLPPSLMAAKVVGSLTFSYTGGITIDCRKRGSHGIPIPDHVDWIRDMSSDARCIIVAEKYGAYYQLILRRFYDLFPCIIVMTTSDDPPDAVTTLFVKRMETELNLPVVALTDGDPSAFQLLSAYGRTPNGVSYDIAPDIKWLGLRPSDCDKYKIPEICWLPMTRKDIKTAQDFLRDDFVRNNPIWVKELEFMLERKKKLEIEALSSLGIGYLIKEYLPRKFSELDWV